MPCKLIAEIGWNHMGDMDLAKNMIHEAKNSGADYAKFQTWKVSNLKSGCWDKDGRRQIYEKAELTSEKHDILQNACKDVGIKFLTSCYSVSDLDLIRSHSNEVKIPGPECYNEVLVKKAIDMFDCVFISSGSATMEECNKWAQFNNVWLMHCVSCYPCLAHNINLPRMLTIKNMTPRYGYSGHLDGTEDAIAAISLGAKVVEKHFTTDKNLPGRDNKFALLPDQFRRIKDYADSFALMSKSCGDDYQECESDVRTEYSGRWT